MQALLLKVTGILNACILLIACSGKPYIVKHTQEENPLRNNTVYVASHGWHTGFILPSRKFHDELPFLKQRFPKTPYLEFGWGDNDFYQAEEITSGLTLQAILWPTESIVHVVAVPAEPASYFPHSEVIAFNLSNNELASLRKFISNTFYRQNNGQVVTLKKGIYGNSQFYKGEGNFYLMNTCNKWTAKGLKSAGMDISTTFKLTAGSIMSFLRQYTSQHFRPAHAQHDKLDTD